jgi:hypothetical protein
MSANDFGQPSTATDAVRTGPDGSDEQELAERMKNMEIEMFHLRQERDNALKLCPLFQGRIESTS